MRELLFFVAGVMLASIFFLTRDTEIVSPAAQQASAVQATTSLFLDSTQKNSEKSAYRVLKVIDGDTLVLDIGGKSTTVRLIGLDTPETVDPRKPVQCFGKEASDRAKELLAGMTVSIEKDPSQGEFDKYGRLLLYVYLLGGNLFNEYMIAEGYAHEYTYNLPYKYQTQFKAAEKQARDEKKGLWTDEACADESERALQPKSSTPAPVAPFRDYECSRNAYNCSSFKTQAEAQAAFEACGLPGQGGAANDVHKLDNDKDGVVCESLP